MQVEEQKTNGSVRYDVMLTERRVEDLQVLQKYGRKDEVPFEAVENDLRGPRFRLRDLRASRRCADGHARRARSQRGRSHPQRAQRWAVSDLNPFLWPLKGMADMVQGEPRAARQRGSDGRDGALDGRHDLRLVGSLSRPARCGGGEHLLPHLWPGQHRHGRRRAEEAAAAEPVDVRDTPLVKEALSHIEEGDRTKAIVRAALLLMKAGTGRRRLSAMKRARELVGKDIGLLDMPAEAAREIIREQSYIVDFEPVKALTALPKLLRTPEDRRRLLDLLDRMEGRIEANAKQITLLGEIRRSSPTTGPRASAKASRSR